MVTILPIFVVICVKKSSKTNIFELSIEATTRFELVIRVLQTHALPLGYVAIVTPTRFELVLPP